MVVLLPSYRSSWCPTPDATSRPAARWSRSKMEVWAPRLLLAGRLHKVVGKQAFFLLLCLLCHDALPAKVIPRWHG